MGLVFEAPPERVIARFAPIRTSIVLVLMSAVACYVAYTLVGMVTGAESVSLGTLPWLLVGSIAGLIFLREAVRVAAAILKRKRVALYVSDGAIVYLAPSYFSVPVGELEFELVGLSGKGLWVRNQLVLKRRGGPVRYVPLFWLSERKDLIAERLRAIQAGV